MNKKGIIAGAIVGIVVIVAAVAEGFEYHHVQVQKAIRAKQEAYDKYVSASKSAAQKGNLYIALKSINQAIALEDTANTKQWKAIVMKLVPRVLTLFNANRHYRLAIDENQALSGSYDVMAISTSRKALSEGVLSLTNNAFNTTYDFLDYQSIMDVLPVGQKVDVQVKDPQGKMKTFSGEVGASPKGTIGFRGSYTNQRFGVSVDLPTLTLDGVNYGWIPSHSGTDGSGRGFTDPLNPAVTVDAYGMNNATFSNPYIPASAHITNSKLTVGLYPAIEYTDVQSVNGVTVQDMSLVAGAPNLNSWNEVDVTVPINQVPKYQVLVNSIIDSFYPGDLTQAY